MRRIDPHAVEGLSDLEDPPGRLWLEGTLSARPAVAIVGTRRAYAEAMRFTRSLARRLAEAGAWIVSGGAMGIDAAAHQGALDAGAPTLVVQAAPLDDPYPRRHRRLFADVLDAGGGWLSETPPGAPAEPWRFLARNRLIAALADAVVVVQAPWKSGALNTAHHAEGLDRPLFAVPGAPWDPRAAGGAALLRERARPCLDAEDLAEVLGIGSAPAPPPTRPPDELMEVLEALGGKPAHPDAIARRAGLSAAEVAGRLVRLQLLGLAAPGPGGWRATGESARL